jgi:hypothetical protein
VQGGAVAAVVEAESTPNRSNATRAYPARRRLRPNEGVVKTARSTVIVVERGNCRDRTLDGDRVLRLHQIIGSVELDPDATHDI